MDLDAAAAVADDLRAAGYTVAALAPLWGSAAEAALRAGDGAPARWAIRDRDDAASVLARLLYFGEPVSRRELDAALPGARVEGAQSLGLVRADGEGVSARLVVRPLDIAGRDGWIASDPDELAGVAPLPPGHVLGVGGAARTLVSLLPERGAGRALDLGCGCGVLALELRARGFEVVATDISPRALGITALNVALNGVDGVETRLGSLFEPVAGERFSFVASNPPFVITPRTGDVVVHEYRDGGLAGDALMAAVVAGLADHLEPDGQARLLGNWEGAAGRVRSWAPRLGMWLVERERLDPAAYARLWIRDGGVAPGQAGYDRLMAAWLGDFAARGVTGIGMGWVIVTAADPALARVEQVTAAVAGAGLGAHVEAALAAHTRLRSLDDAALAASVLRVCPDVTEARHHLPGVEAPAVIELRQGGGLGRAVEADPGLAALVGACDGDLPAGALIDAIAELLDVEAGALRAELIPRVRELLFTGFLTLCD
ncbi:MAG: methyltransferase [Microbacterium sp.]